MRRSLSVSITIGIALVALVAVTMSGLALATTGGTNAAAPPASTVPGPRADHPRPRVARRRAVLRTAAEVLGIDPEELVRRLAGGATLAQIADEEGVGRDRLVDALVDAVAGRVDAAIAAGRLDASRRDEILGRARDAIERRIDTPVRLPRRVARRDARKRLAEVLGMSEDELGRAMHDGRSVADLAEERGIPLDDVVAALLAPIEKRLQGAVDAGHITEEEMRSRLDTMEQRLRERLEKAPAPRPGRRRGVAPLAKALGMTPDELRSALRDGKTLPEIVTERGLTPEQVADELLAEAKARLDEIAARRHLDPAQLEQRLERLRRRIIDRLGG